MKDSWFEQDITAKVAVPLNTNIENDSAVMGKFMKRKMIMAKSTLHLY